MQICICNAVHGPILWSPSNRHQNNALWIEPERLLRFTARTRSHRAIHDRRHHEISIAINTSSRPSQILCCFSQIDHRMADTRAQPEQMVGMIEEKNGWKALRFCEGQQRNYVFAMDVKNEQIVMARQPSQFPYPFENSADAPIDLMNGPPL